MVTKASRAGNHVQREITSHGVELREANLFDGTCGNRAGLGHLFGVDQT